MACPFDSNCLVDPSTESLTYDLTGSTFSAVAVQRTNKHVDSHADLDAVFNRREQVRPRVSASRQVFQKLLFT